MTVAVVTDSAASIPPDLAAEHGVTVIPMLLMVGAETYADGQLPLGEVLTHLDDGVSTSGPSPARVLETIESVLARADTALVLTIAATMSSTYDVMQLAARDFGDRVRVVDTATAAGAEGLVVLAAARRAETGDALDEVEAAAREAIERVRLVATVPHLDRLVESGRVPGIAGWAGDKLGINPLFQFRSGQAKPLRPAFSRDAALERIFSTWQVTSTDPGQARLHAAALHAEAEAEAHRLLDQVRRVTPPATAFVGEFSPVMVVHVGQGLVGLAWWWELH